MSIQDDFFKKYAPLAQREQLRSGLPASLLLAQMIQESGFKLSELASKYNNPFGIKADSSWKGEKVLLPTTEYVNGKTVKTKAWFRVYDSIEEGFMGRTDFFQKNKRYAGLLTMSNPFAGAEELQRVGYATDKNYAQSLKNHITTYNLTQYDNVMDISKGGSGSGGLDYSDPNLIWKLPGNIDSTDPDAKHHTQGGNNQGVSDWIANSDIYMQDKFGMSWKDDLKELSITWVIIVVLLIVGIFLVVNMFKGVTS